MNKKIAIAASLVVAAVVAWYAQIVMSEVGIMQAHPEIDPKVVVKASRIMLRRTYAGRYNDIDMTDEKCEEIFLAIVKEITE